MGHYCSYQLFGKSTEVDFLLVSGPSSVAGQARESSWGDGAAGAGEEPFGPDC